MKQTVTEEQNLVDCIHTLTIHNSIKISSFPYDNINDAKFDDVPIFHYNDSSSIQILFIPQNTVGKQGYDFYIALKVSQCNRVSSRRTRSIAKIDLNATDNEDVTQLVETEGTPLKRKPITLLTVLRYGVN